MVTVSASWTWTAGERPDQTIIVAVINYARARIGAAIGWKLRFEPPGNGAYLPGSTVIEIVAAHFFP